MSAEPSGGGDPRVLFAAERTLLAWVRTALAVMGLGFVVARFGLFMRTVAAALGRELPDPSSSPLRGHASTALGVALVGLAVAMLLAASRQHRRFLATLAPVDRPREYRTPLGLISAVALALIGLLLAVSLVVWTH